MKDDLPFNLTFDDVLLKPRFSQIKSRGDVSLRTKLTSSLFLNTPLISANMDTVTESKMAIALAEEGGIGIIHRFLAIEDQVAKVERVKRKTNLIIENPYIAGPEMTLLELKKLMKEKESHGILVADEKHRLLGIVTNRDVVLEDDMRKKVKEVMTPRNKLIVGKAGITIEEAKKLLKHHKIEKLPLVDTHDILQGLITLKDIVEIEEKRLAVKDKKGRLLVGAAIGVKGDFFERAGALLSASADVLVLDIAHGHSEIAVNAVKKIKNTFDCELVAGNVATADGVKDLIAAGADAVKVGIGPGAACSTRIVTGVGVPQLSAILECALEAQKYSKGKIPIIADGGIRSSADLMKALAAGAETAILGSLFAGTDESPGAAILKDHKKYKLYRGMASLTANLAKKRIDKEEFDEEVAAGEVIPEGVEKLVSYKGSVHEVIHQLLGGLRSGMSYLNAKTIKDLHKNAQFIRITEAGREENAPHD